jgi:PhzF family phenazine biosynthesis protein
MPDYRFRLVNVFTRERGALTGNPLCVFEAAAGLDTPTMQALALQFNLSETTFLFPSTLAAARVRIFTPRYEMPFAGHPTLGSAHVCRLLQPALQSLQLELAVGLVSVRAEGDRWTLAAPAPTWRELEVPTATLAAALGLEAQDIGTRPLWIKAGKEQLVVPLRSVAAVRRAAPRADAFTQLISEDGVSMAYLFAQNGANHLESRFFFPQGASILEDPATGSATANLGGWYRAMGVNLPLAVEIAQGAATGRPSTLYLDVDASGGIFVGGDVCEIGRGLIHLD